jgi:Ca2+-binding EF-hand superfamily protein
VCQVEHVSQVVHVSGVSQLSQVSHVSRERHVRNSNTSFLGAFRLYDVDNDGYITRQEMYDIVDAIYQMVVSFFSFFIDK